MIVVLTLAWGTTYNRQTYVMSHLRAQNALDRAVKAAVMKGVTLSSLANDAPYIDSTQAQAAFKVALAENLHLDPVTLAPLDSSGLVAEAPAVQLLVYNGPFPYYYSNPAYHVSATFTKPGVLAMIDVKVASPFLKQPQLMKLWAKSELYKKP